MKFSSRSALATLAVNVGLLYLWLPAIKGDLEPTFGRCCGFGVNWAREKKQCSTFPAPVAGIPSEHQSICITSATICCLRMYRDEQCQKGKQFAQGGQECLASTEEGGEFFKDCCDACKLGLVSGSMGMGCNLRFKFGFPWDNAYLQCCSQTSPTNALTPDLSGPVTGGAGGQGGGFGFDTLYPGVSNPGLSVPESKDLCARFPGKLCAHVCVPTPGSYRCQCRAGFTLSTDGKTCLQDALTDRCQLNNPCAHICKDTGISIECLCNPGYKLARDQRSCEDVNECNSGQHRCVAGEQVCYNQVGSYACINADGSLSSPGQTQHQSIGGGGASLSHSGDSREITGLGSTAYGVGDGTLGVQGYVGVRQEQSQGRCPPGYKFNLEIRACDDVDECEVVSELCGRGAICQNTIGSYTCTQLPVADCPPGFAFDINLQSCLDVNECDEGLDNCDRATHFCLNSQGSFTCQEKGGPTDCVAGYKYSPQQQTCVDVDECTEELHGCDPSEEVCRNTAGAYECDMKCDEGFHFSLALRTCVDRDECVDVPCDSGWECHNTAGSYTCHELPRALCPAGYKPSNSSTTGCEDIDECAENSFSCERATQTCINSVGSFRCFDRTPACDFGYRFNEDQRSCVDIDECVEDVDDCVDDQECINTLGSYQCHTKGAVTQTCHPGFTFNRTARACVDIDECLEGSHDCSPSEDCLNRRGDYVCQPRESSNSVLIQSSQARGDKSTAFNSERKEQGRGSIKRGRCEEGYRYNRRQRGCFDIDECEEGRDICNKLTERCENTLGDYWCAPILITQSINGSVTATTSATTTTTSTTSTTTTTTTPAPTLSVRPQPTGPRCPVGTSYNTLYRSCRDIDECDGDPCSESELCENTQGSFKCDCRDGFLRDESTKDCKDLNECQLGLHTCESTQRCDNTIGSYACIRIAGCGTGYTLNHNTGECDDNDECVLGTHDCDQLGPQYQCINIKGSFRCSKKICPPMQRLGIDGSCIKMTCEPGFKPGDRTCIDINECAEGSPCRRNEQCLNTFGSYRCRALLNCGVGYQMNDRGTECVDIDECTEGTHQCTGNQVCSNRQGGYICQCPVGYRLNSQRQCQDVNECESYFGSICTNNAVCENTDGSYRCNCKKGFKQSSDGRACSDVDECVELPGICHHNCINVWGSHQCTCRAGFNLAVDNRTCTDVDECLEFKGRGRLCIGMCVNTPGTFKCSCPEGYRLATDGRTCKDINECETGTVCQGVNEHCVNTRGGYECNTITCPSNYIRDTQHKNRCKKVALFCREDDEVCRRKPLSYSYNFLPLVSNLTLPGSGQVDLFTMRGPLWSSTTVQFELELESARAPVGLEEATREFFLLKRTSFNQAVISLVKPIIGPQEIKLSLNMQLYHEGTYGGSAVAELLIYVSEYDF